MAILLSIKLKTSDIQFFQSGVIMSEVVLSAAQSVHYPNDISASLDEHLRLIHAAIDSRAQMVLFPELSLTGYDRSLTDQDAIAPNDSRLVTLLDAVKGSGLVAVIGSPCIRRGELTIASYSLYPDGRVLTYTKRYLHPGEEVAFHAGNGGDLVSLEERDIGLAICAEINHGNHVAESVARGAKVYAASCILTPSGYVHDCQVLRDYAVKYGVAVMMANFGSASGGFESAGGTAIWSPEGVLLAAAPESGSALVVASCSKGDWQGRWTAV